MKTLALTIFTVACILNGNAQTSNPINSDSLRRQAILLGIDSVDIPGYIKLHSGSIAHEGTEGQDIHFQPTPSVQFFTNPGFESGDYTGYTGVIGDNTVSSMAPLQNIMTGIFTGALNPQITDPTARHSIMSPAGGNDPQGNFPVCPSGYGNFTARLGNASANYQGQSIEKTWTATSADSNIVFSYAVVMYDGLHLASESSYFKYELLDSAGNVLLSRVDLSLALPPTYLAATSPSTKYLPWTLDTLNASTYAGQNVTFRVTASGCIYGGHFTYCYLDFDPNNANTVGISDVAVSELSLYPNPSITGVYNVIHPNPTTGDAVVRITDLYGRIVPAIVTPSENGWTIDIGTLDSGIYNLNIEQNGVILNSKLIR